MRLRYFLIMLLVPALGGLVAAAVSGYASSTLSWGPDTYCGFVGEKTVSGFPLVWKVDDRLLGMTGRNCAIFIIVTPEIFYLDAFLLDALFYAAIGYAAAFGVFVFRSRLKAYSNSIPSINID